MTAFIAVALLLALAAVAFIAVPLLKRAGTPAAPLSAALAGVLLILAAAALYALLGNWSWRQVPPGNASISQLVRRLGDRPEDLNGWVLLGQQYGAIGQYALAVRAYERANRIANGTSAAALSGWAEVLTLSGDTAQAGRASELFERALQLDPHSPKALFYSAVGAYNAGNLPLARSRFAAMLALNPPEHVRDALAKQIAAIDAQMNKVADPATAISLHITLAPALAAKIPANASLFVFVRAPEGGAPLAARRGAATLPQTVQLSAADAMIAGHAVQPGQNVQVVARISASGSPLAQHGDLYGELRYVAGKDGPRELAIDKISP